MKITKDPARQFSVPGNQTSPASNGEDGGTEPVHAIAADRDSPTRELSPFGRLLERAQTDSDTQTPESSSNAIGSPENQTPAMMAESQIASPAPLPPWGEERRKGDRRQRQVDVMLDTRITFGRRMSDRSINVKV